VEKDLDDQLRKATRKLERARTKLIDNDHENVPGALVNIGIDLTVMDKIKNVNDECGKENKSLAQ
jgi:hypothetical protein